MADGTRHFESDDPVRGANVTHLGASLDARGLPVIRTFIPRCSRLRLSLENWRSNGLAP